MLQNIFDGIEPVINKNIGGSEYKNELMDIIMEACDVPAGDIHINDVYKNSEEYMELIHRISLDEIHINDVYKNSEEYASLIRRV